MKLYESIFGKNELKEDAQAPEGTGHMKKLDSNELATLLSRYDIVVESEGGDEKSLGETGVGAEIYGLAQMVGVDVTEFLSDFELDTKTGRLHYKGQASPAKIKLK